MLLIVEIEYYQRSIIFRRLLFRNEKLFTISVPDFNFIVCLVIEGTRPEGIIIVSLMLQPSNFLRLPTTQPLPPRATFSSFRSLFFRARFFPRFFSLSSTPFYFLSALSFLFLSFLFFSFLSLFPPSSLPFISTSDRRVYIDKATSQGRLPWRGQCHVVGPQSSLTE